MALCSFLDVFFKEAEPHIVFSEEKKGLHSVEKPKIYSHSTIFRKSIDNWLDF